jgi:Tol biopolymer transport system component
MVGFRRRRWRTLGLLRAPLWCCCAAVLGALLMFTSACGQGSEPARSTEPIALPLTRNGKIAFQTNRDGNYEIYAVNADGTSLTRLSSDPSEDIFPAWSPGGTEIAFTRCPPGQSYPCEVYVMNGDGTGATNLTHSSSNDGEPAWSPDGTEIAFSSDRGGIAQIYVMNADGTAVRQVSEAPEGGTHPAWSPDGQLIAFSTTPTERGAIYVVNIDGSGEREVFVDEQEVGDFLRADAWSPDGMKILFTRGPSTLATDQSVAGIWWLEPAGTGSTRLLPYTDAAEASWSPDGTKIVLARTKGDAQDIYVTNADGSGADLVFSHPAIVSAPNWQPVAD